MEVDNDTEPGTPSKHKRRGVPYAHSNPIQAGIGRHWPTIALIVIATSLLLALIRSNRPHYTQVQLSTSRDCDLPHHIPKRVQLGHFVARDRFGQNVTVTIVCMGGSATAGAKVNRPYHYPEALGQMLALYNSPNFRVINQGQGATGSFYGALTFSSQVPAETRFVTWEYSINDATRLQDFDDEDWNVHERMVFRSFMRQVALHPLQPKVIVIFLWDTPFTLPPITNAANALKEEAQAHPLVVGVIDVAHHIRITCDNAPNSCRKDRFVVDRHHPNMMVHLQIAGDLYELITNDVLNNGINKNAAMDDDKAVPDFDLSDWSCENTSPAGTEVFLKLLAKTRRTIAWTAHNPVQPQQGLIFHPGNEGPADLFANAGKASEERNDRNMELTHIPVCGQNVYSFTPRRPCTNPLGFVFRLGAHDLGARDTQSMSLLWNVPGYTVRHLPFPEDSCYLDQSPKEIHGLVWIELIVDESYSAVSRDLEILVCSVENATRFAFISVFCDV